MGYRLISVAAAALCAASAVSADTQNDAERRTYGLDEVRDVAGDTVRKTRSGLEDAALAPLEDLNMRRDEIPEEIKDLESYTENDGALTCAAIGEEMDELNDALGSEAPRRKADKSVPRKLAERASGAAVDTVAGEVKELVPFRGVVRKVSGADAYDKRRSRAFTIGKQRRAYLRGAWAAMACDARPDDAVGKGSSGPKASGAPLALNRVAYEDAVEEEALDAPDFMEPLEPISSPPSAEPAPAEAPETTHRKLPSLG